MSIIFLLIPLSVVLAAVFLAAFIWAVRSGQYEDTCTPAMRLLLPEAAVKPAPGPASRSGGASPAGDTSGAAAEPSAQRPSPFTCKPSEP